MTRALLAWRYVVLGVVAVVAGVLTFNARQFEIDASADTLLTHDNEKYVRSKATTQRFSPQEFLLVAYEPVDHALLTPRTFGDLRALSRRIGELERVQSVRSILNVPLLTLADGGSFGALDADRLTVDEAGYDPATVAAALRDHPIYEDLLIDDQQSVTALQVLFRSNPKLEKLRRRITNLEIAALDSPPTGAESGQLERLRAEAAPLEEKLAQTRHREVEAIRAVAADYDGGANIYLGGVHVLGHELVRIVRNDLVVFGAAIAVVVAALLWLLFRDLRWVVIAGLLCAVGIGSTIGLFGLVGLEATVVSANFVALQLILTLAIVVHLIVQYRELAGRCPNWSHERLILKTMSAKSPPCIYAAVTTALGFGALLVSGFEPVVSFGWMMIVAIAVTLLATLTLFPVLLSILGGRSDASEPAFMDRWLGRSAAFAVSRGSLIAAGTVIVVVGCAAGFARLDVENSFIDYFADDTDVHRELTFIDRRLGGSTPLDLVYPVPAPAGDLLLDAKQFTDMQKLVVRLAGHEAVGKILSLESFTALAREVNDGRPVTEYEMTAAWRVMDENIRESLLGSFYSPEAREVRIGLRIRDTTPGLDRGALLDDVRADALSVLGPDTRVRTTSLFVLYQDILARLLEAQVSTFAFVLLALFVAFLAIFRSFRVALAALVPNVLITAAVFGAMGWLSIPLDLMTITIAAIAMGIAVDDTIHYVHRYRVEARSVDVREAVRRTHRSVGCAVVYTTIIVAAGFASLAFSDFVPSALFGLLTGMALLAALVFDLTVLPALLARFPEHRNDDGRR